ncbi:MAG: hypothetical protein J7L95_02355 [Prolixibacteraceae bacterium]|nr:hypothetical protein [Prolixibacteraceae bacterium]
MILRIFKSNRPVNLILFPAIGFLLWLGSFLQPEKYPFYLGENKNLLFLPIGEIFGTSPFVQVLLAFILLIVLALLMQQINNRYTFIRRRTFLPATLFVFIVSGFTGMHTLHPVYFAAVFLLLAILRLFTIFDKPKSYSAIFDSGLLLGIGSLFYFNLFLLLPAFWAGIAILSRDYRWREFVVLFIGFLLPFIFAFGYSFLTDQLMELLKIFERNIVTVNNHFKLNISLHIFLGFLILLTGIGSVRIIQQYDSKKVSTRKYFVVFFLLFIFSMSGFIFIPATSQEMLVITAIPVTFLVSNLFVFMKNNFWSNLLFYLFTAMVIFMQFDIL